MLKEERHMEKYKVILVDDEIEAIQAMEHKMDWDGLGFEVSGSATNGVKALELVENIQPDVVITDIKMPYMNGLELAQKLNNDYPNIHIIICITKISTFLILCDLAVCLATLYVSFSLVFALMRYLQGKVFLIRFYSPTTLSSSRAEFRLPSRLACA